MTDAHFDFEGLKHFATVPGAVVALFVSDDKLYCAYAIRRRWWQFWFPVTRIKVMRVKEI